MVADNSVSAYLDITEAGGTEMLIRRTARHEVLNESLVNRPSTPCHDRFQRKGERATQLDQLVTILVEELRERRAVMWSTDGDEMSDPPFVQIAVVPIALNSSPTIEWSPDATRWLSYQR